MIDMLGREIKEGDYILRFWGCHGSFGKRFTYVIGFTKKQIRIAEGNWSDKPMTIAPYNVIVMNDIPIEHRDKLDKKEEQNVTIRNTEQIPINYIKEQEDESNSSGSGRDRIVFGSPSR